MKSRSSAGSVSSETRRRLLEAEANMAQLELQLRMESEARDLEAKKRADEIAQEAKRKVHEAAAADLAARKEAEQKLLSAKLELQRQQLEFEIAEEGEDHSQVEQGNAYITVDDDQTSRINE